MPYLTVYLNDSEATFEDYYELGRNIEAKFDAIEWEVSE